MKFYLSALFILVTATAVLAITDSRYSKINIADYCSHFEALNGRLVEINAKVIAINADSNSMELFDSESRTMIVVKMNALAKSQRNALIGSDVRRVTVAGRASMVSGRLVIDAQKIEATPVPTTTEEETVPVAN